MTAPLILALDPAKNCGVAIGRAGDKPALSSRYLGSDADHTVIFGNATEFLATLLSRQRPDLIAIEAPIRASYGFTTADTTDISRGLFAIFTGIVRCKRIELETPPPNTWRKYSLGAGNGNLKRAEAKRAALKMCRMLRWDAADDDAAEAGMIWMYGCGRVAPKLVPQTDPLFLSA